MFLLHVCMETVEAWTDLVYQARLSGVREMVWHDRLELIKKVRSSLMHLIFSSSIKWDASRNNTCNGERCLPSTSSCCRHWVSCPPRSRKMLRLLAFSSKRPLRYGMNTMSARLKYSGLQCINLIQSCHHFFEWGQPPNFFSSLRQWFLSANHPICYV